MNGAWLASPQRFVPGLCAVSEAGAACAILGFYLDIYLFCSVCALCVRRDYLSQDVKYRFDTRKYDLVAWRACVACFELSWGAMRALSSSLYCGFESELSSRATQPCKIHT